MIAMFGVAELFILLLVALVGFAGLAALIGIIVALSKGRPGVALAIGGGALLAVLMVPALLWFTYMARSATHSVAITTPGMNTYPQLVDTSAVHFEGHYTSTPRTAWRISFFPVIALGVLFVVLLTGIFRHGASRSGDEHGGRRGVWPVAVVALILLLVLGLVGVPWISLRKEVTRREHDVRALHAIAAQRQQMEIHRRDAAASAARARRAIDSQHAEMQRQIAQMDIHELMDKVDAPRIALAAEAPESPPPPESPAPPTDPAVSSDAATGESAEESAGESQTTAANDDAAAPAAEEANAEEGADSAEEAVPRDEKKAVDENAAAPADEKVDNAAEADSAAPAAENAKHTKAPPEEPAQTSEAPPAEATTATPPALKRPDWIDDPPKRVGQTWREVVETDEYATVPECYRAADILLQLATYDHLARLVGMRNYAEGDRPSIPLPANFDEYDSHIRFLSSLGIGIDYIRREIAKDEHIHKAYRSFGPMAKLYTLIEFSPAIDRELRQRWEARERQERFAGVGAGASAVLALLGGIWALLKIDTWTKGYYTKRLFLGVPAAIIGGFLLLLAYIEIVN